jgi:hypothetical protein
MRRSLIDAYSRLLRERPIATNTAQGATLAALGDVTAQWLEGRSGDAKRTLRAGCIGAGFAGFVYPPVYARLDALWPGTLWPAVLRKSLTECALLGTFGNGTSLLLRGLPPSDVLASMPNVLLNEARVWLPYNLVAFSLVPRHIRPTTTSCLTVGWHTYISWLANDAPRPGAGALQAGAPSISSR